MQEAGGEGKKKDKARQSPSDSSLGAFWSTVVEDLFLSSHERKYLGFQLFSLVLPFLGYHFAPLAPVTPMHYSCHS